MTQQITDRTPNIPSFSDADFRTVRLMTMRRTARRIVDEDIDGKAGREQILATSRRAAPQVNEPARADACEQLIAALAELDRVRSDMWAGTDLARQVADLDADDDAENALKKLLGDLK